MDEITVTWGDAKDVPNFGSGSFIGGLGGWFKEGMRWDDYLADLKDHDNEDQVEMFEALRRSMIEHRIRHGGDWHQVDPRGTPIFSNGWFGSFSYRAWGDLSAAVWSSADGQDYAYMDFYMDDWNENPGSDNL